MGHGSLTDEIKAIGFDLDNTLYVSTPQIQGLIQHNIITMAAQHLNRDYDSVKTEYDRQFLITQSGSSSLKALGIVEASELVQTALERTDIASALNRDDRLISMMDRLSSRYQLFLITGSSQDEASNKFKAIGLNPCVFDMKLYNDSKYSRKDGAAFDYISQKLSVPLENMIFVGDREKVDIIPALNKGLYTAMVNGISKYASFNLDDIYSLEKILK